MHDMLLNLSGLYVKSAQILASKGDFMPEPWCRRLAAMFDSMPPKPWAHVARVCHSTANTRLPLLQRCFCQCAKLSHVAGALCMAMQLHGSWSTEQGHCCTESSCNIPIWICRLCRRIWQCVQLAS